MRYATESSGSSSDSGKHSSRSTRGCSSRRGELMRFGGVALVVAPAELLLHLASAPYVAAAAIVAAVCAVNPPSSIGCGWDFPVWALLQHCGSSVRDLVLCCLFAVSWPLWLAKLIAFLSKLTRWNLRAGHHSRLSY